MKTAPFVVFLVVTLLIGQPYLWGQGLPAKLVTFVQSDAQPFEAIVSSAVQSNIPIGLVLGQKRELLCNLRHSFEIHELLPKDAFSEAIAGTGYHMEERGGVLLPIAPDLTPRQRSLLDFRVEGFGSSNEATMAELSAQLTGWLMMEAEHVEGFASSTLSSRGSQGVVLGKITSASTEEIANRIVSLGPKGLWVFRVNPVATTSPQATVWRFIRTAMTSRQ